MTQMTCKKPNLCCSMQYNKLKWSNGTWSNLASHYAKSSIKVLGRIMKKLPLLETLRDTFEKSRQNCIHS